MRFFTVLFLIALPLLHTHTATAQSAGWGNLEGLIAQHLQGRLEGSRMYWLPSDLDPSKAGEALAFHYRPIVDAASNSQLFVGYFVNTSSAGFQFVRPVSELFGHEPQAAVFYPDRIEVTTLMPGPNDPRCCPTKLTRWSIDRVTMQATPLN